jgi:small subunit ribosomal protein S17
MASATQRGERKTRYGVVVSDKMDKTRVVSVERLVQHPLYRRTIRQTARLKAHDETNETRAGDRVRVMETRPLSKEKRWRIVEVLERAK